MKRTDEAPRQPGQVDARRRRRPGAAADTPRPEAALALSKTRRKAQMHAVQDLGEALVKLNSARVALLSLPERVEEAIAEARTITRWEARRRQMQYIGRLMREVDVEPIRARLAEWSGASNAEKARMSAVERWRERLLTDRSALDSLCAEAPQADRRQLSGLVVRANQERTLNEPPHAYRELFRVLNSLLRGGA